jgi:hypothetical protein
MKFIEILNALVSTYKLLKVKSYPPLFVFHYMNDPKRMAVIWLGFAEGTI